MFRLLYVTVALYLTGVIGNENKCKILLDYDHENSTCCTIEPINRKEYKETFNKTAYRKFKECEDLPSDDSQCSERDICKAKKLGIIDDNINIKEDEVKKLFEIELKPTVYPEVYKNIMDKCFGDNMSRNKSKETCSLKKLNDCLIIQYYMGCVEWSEEDSFKEMKNSAIECAKFLQTE